MEWNGKSAVLNMFTCFFILNTEDRIGRYGPFSGCILLLRIFVFFYRVRQRTSSFRVPASMFLGLDLMRLFDKLGRIG